MQIIIKKDTGKGAPVGDIVEIRSTSTPHAGPNAPFCTVEVADEKLSNWLDKGKPWKINVDYVLVNSDPAIDGYRLRMFSTTQNASATKGAVTRDQVETFINNWNGSVHSFGQNEVVFDITILDAIKSVNFWDVTPGATWFDDVVFTEISYDQGTGVHRVSADFSAISKNPTAVERKLLDVGVDIISHADKVVTFDAERSLVRSRFESDMHDKAERTVERYRYRVNTGVVDYVVGQGGFVQTDLTTLLGYVKDKLED